MSVKSNKQGKSHSIFFKTFRPVLFVTFLIMGVFAVALQQNILSYLSGSAAASFDEQVEKRKISLENIMISRWSKIDDSVDQVVQKIEERLKREGADASRIHTDASLNQMILRDVMEDVIGTLKISGTTEIFFVLDGAVDKQEDKKQKAGIYLRNSNPDSYSGNNGNLLFERGIPSISKEWQIPLDSFWKTGFTIAGGRDTDSDFFNKPIQAAKNSDSHDFRNFAYWSFGHPIDTADQGILTYSVPLITSGWDVVGVMGVGVSENYLNPNLDYKELGGGRTGAYLLAKTTEDGSLEAVVLNGTSYDKAKYTGQRLMLQKTRRKGFIRLLNDTGQESGLCVSSQKLGLYNSNTPFEQEQWMLLGLQKEEVLLSDYHNAQKMLGILVVAGVFLSMFGVFWTSRFITVPIRRLVLELRKSDPNRPIHLQRVNVEEIDELTSSIENLSARVASAFSRISVIIQMTESGIGVFEYKIRENLVFLSKGINEMLNWSLPESEAGSFVDAARFTQCFEELMKHKVAGEENLIEICFSDGKKRWVRLNQMRESDSILGVLTDVTVEVMEKRKIEYERDYDVLTNIYNRRAFEDKIRILFDQPGRMKKAVLLMWDLDNLKYLNDTYGHIAGDDYIRALGACLKESAGEHVLSARRSGDEFVTLIYGLDSEEVLAGMVQRLWEQVNQAQIVLPNKKTYKIRVSAGKAWYPRDAESYETLFQFADFAMYTVKHSKKGSMEDFNSRIYEENSILLQGQEEFNNLVEQHLVRYMLQPIVSASDGSIYGYEMLMRSQIDLFQSPLDILRMAHSQSKLYDLEVMTWFEAMKTFVRMSEDGRLAKDSRVFINSIANQMMLADILELFQKTYRGYLSKIVCEFTEEEQNNTELTSKKIRIMRDWNALIAIDDYGCGYNSETVLLEIKPDIVKIDMSIVRGINGDESRKRLAGNLILYAKERNMLVLGEGVETKEELQTLIGLGVDLLQGYLIARPSYEAAAPEKEITELIARLSAH